MITVTESHWRTEENGASGCVPVACWADTIYCQSLSKEANACQQTPRGWQTLCSNRSPTVCDSADFLRAVYMPLLVWINTYNQSDVRAAERVTSNVLFLIMSMSFQKYECVCSFCVYLCPYELVCLHILWGRYRGCSDCYLISLKFFIFSGLV